MEAVYICASQAEPDVVKIGAVRKTTPEHRVKQQKCPFGSVPRLLEFFETEWDAIAIEQIAHKELNSRLLFGREWFITTPHVARWSVLRAMKEYDRRMRRSRLLYDRPRLPLLDFGERSYNWWRTWYGDEIAEMQRTSMRATLDRKQRHRAEIVGLIRLRSQTG